MGEVYCAVDSRLGRQVAIKLLPAAFSSDRNRLQRFEQEARTASRLNHPNILTIYDIGTHDGVSYIVSELLTGQTLRERLGESLPLQRAVDYALQIARGLAAAHEKGIVHRDLKPENLFLTKDGRVKILDFGLAKLKSPPEALDENDSTQLKATAPGMLVGTVGYMSPEQVRAEEVDHRSDIFAFGAIFYDVVRKACLPRQILDRSAARNFKGGLPRNFRTEVRDSSCGCSHSSTLFGKEPRRSVSVNRGCCLRPRSTFGWSGARVFSRGNGSASKPTANFDRIGCCSDCVGRSGHHLAG